MIYLCRVNNSRNIHDKIYRSGTEEMALYKVGPQTNRNLVQNDKELNPTLFTKTQGYGRNTVE